MLQGCPVVTAAGELIGEVRQLIIDARTLQLRYVLVAGKRKRCAEIAIPWKTLYFDSAMARLVFYTWQ
ncbi:MAG: PRC-barrel domain containing protein [Noviherbaspirillum sp.]|nr:PRC-barrel domain containing protein [Noviherbaspirillum sp.]MDB5795607.1 PRC-barrel domain containing protein [Noviherbaspirillum sp.]